MKPFEIQRSNLHFRGWQPLVQTQQKKIRGRNLKIQHCSSFDLNNLERPKGEFLKKSWDSRISPNDARNSIVFFVQFYLDYPTL